MSEGIKEDHTAYSVVYCTPSLCSVTVVFGAPYKYSATTTTTVAAMTGVMPLCIIQWMC